MARLRRYRLTVARRTRILAYGSAAVLTVAGFIAAAIGGLGGQVAAIALISAGLGGALLLVFYEVGLSEDRDRADAERRRRRRR
jgi:fatty acid desaturase